MQKVAGKHFKEEVCQVCGDISKKVTVVQDSSGSAHG